jgi:hypothetical protein
MMSAIHESSSWTRGRFLGVAGVLFVLQVGLLFLFGSRSSPQTLLPPPSVHFRSLGAAVDEAQLMRDYFVGDPAVFPLPNQHGFSGRGWLNQQPLRYQSEIQLEPPAWLTLDTSRLGTNFPALPSGDESILRGLADQLARREEPLPAFLAPENIATQSIFRLEDGLSDRLLGGVPVLGAWPSPQLLTNSTVQIAVDHFGEVVAARLVGRSGLGEADTDALAKARALRFRPSPSSETIWGEAVFQWQTTEPAGADPPK